VGPICRYLEGHNVKGFNVSNCGSTCCTYTAGSSFSYDTSDLYSEILGRMIKSNHVFKAAKCSTYNLRRNVLARVKIVRAAEALADSAHLAIQVKSDMTGLVNKFYWTNTSP